MNKLMIECVKMSSDFTYGSVISYCSFCLFSIFSILFVCKYLTAVAGSLGLGTLEKQSQRGFHGKKNHTTANRYIYLISQY